MVQLVQPSFPWNPHSQLIPYPACRPWHAVLVQTFLICIFAQALFSAACQCACTCSRDPPLKGAAPSRDPSLRLSALQLTERLLADSSRAVALCGPPAAALAQKAILPALVWRAGKTAAAVRFAAVAALASMLQQQLLGQAELAGLLGEGRLLPGLVQASALCTTTRHCALALHLGLGMCWVDWHHKLEGC